MHTGEGSKAVQCQVSGRADEVQRVEQGDRRRHRAGEVTGKRQDGTVLQGRFRGDRRQAVRCGPVGAPILGVEHLGGESVVTQPGAVVVRGQKV